MKKYIKLMTLIFYILIDTTHSFKLNNTFNHGNQVEALCKVQIESSRYYLASGGNDGSIKIWDLENSRLIFTFNQFNGSHSRAVSSFLSLGNGLLASGSDDGAIKLWDLKNGIVKNT